MSNDTTARPVASTTPAELEFDPDEMRKRYRRERDKRLRPEGEAQYFETSGEYAHYANTDPFAGQPEPREPMTDEIEVVVVGGGFSGMLMAARVRELGIADV